MGKRNVQRVTAGKRSTARRSNEQRAEGVPPLSSLSPPYDPSIYDHPEPSRLPTVLGPDFARLKVRA